MFKTRIKSKYILYNECSSEYFKINDDAGIITGIIIKNLYKVINKSNLKRIYSII